MFAVLTLPAGAAQLQQLHGQVPRAAATLTPVGRLPASQRLSFAIGLPLRDRGALSNLLQQIYDPTSANYHHYLTPQQFAERFGPTAQDYEAVVAFARNNGLTVSARHPNRTLLDVEGSVADIEKALHIRMNSYRHPVESRTFYAPDSDPSLDLAVPLAGISGLDNYSRPRPSMTTALLAGRQQASPNTGSGLEGTYMGKDFRAAYAPDSTLMGAGQSVGLLQFDGYTASDITYYESIAGLPNVTLTNVLLDGFGGGPSGFGGEVEVSLDIEMSISMAPGLSNVIVYMAGPNGNWHDILNRMANDNLAKQLSCSWYIPGGAADPVADGIFQQMAAQGQSFMAASGDFDAYSGLIPFPGDTPYITEVGGTFLTTSGPAGPWVSETAWNRGGGIGTGGGISTQYPIPSWQSPVSMTANYGSTTMRNMPDVALTADNVYVRADGLDYGVGGTSCAAPLWAGFTSLMNQQAAANGLPTVGFLNPLVYKLGLSGGYAQAFHDITTGNNGSATHFPAVPGYDLCTGWGTPRGQQLINAIVPPDTLVITPAAGFAATGAVGGPFSASAQNFTLTNTSAGALTWSVGNPAAWLATSSSGGVLPKGSATNLMVSLNSVSSNLAPGLYAINLAVTNVTSNFVHLLPFSLLVHDPLVISPTNGFNSVGPVGGPFSIAAMNLSLSNSGAAPVSWALSNNAPWLDVSASSGTLGVGGLTSVTVSLDPSANTLPPALYAGNLVFSNLTGALVQNLPFTLQTGELPLQNGGFELGNFTGWTLTGNTVGMLVSPNPAYVHSGVYGAELGPQGSLGYLNQTLATSPGQVYLISFWLENLGVSGPDEFQVNWNGSTVFDELNAGTSGWTNIQILVGASGTNSILQFGARNDNASFGLDDVAVFQSAVPGTPPTITTQPVNEAVTAGLTATFTAGVTGIEPIYYQWQLGTSNIMGATNATLMLSPVTPGEAGNYTVVVSNAFGLTNSSNAVLTVNVPMCDPPPSSLVSWWAAEGNPADSFGANNGVVQGNLTYVPGVVGQAFQFDGTTTAVHVPASASMNVGTNSGLTIEGWIKPSSLTANQPLADWNNGSDTLAVHFWINQPVIWSGTGTGSMIGVLDDNAGGNHWIDSPANVLSTNSWNHVALTYDQASGTAALYLNGTAVAVQNLGSFTPLTTYDFYLGYSPPDPSFSVGYYSGLMDEMSVYNTALSSNQIQAIYNAGSTGKCAVAPVIAGQPQSETVFAGSTASFSVNAGGSQPLSYQWSLNQTNIPAATNATLVLTDVQLEQSGNIYSVLVTNLEGSTNSSNAVLTVNPPPPCAPPAASLVSWWAAEGNTADSFGGNNGVAQGNLTYAPGEVDQAFQFDGASAAVHVPASTSMNVGTNSGLTIEGWIKPSSLTANQPLAEWNNGSDTLAVHFWINQPTIYSGNGPGSMIGILDDNAGGNHWINSPPNVLSTNSWNHVALTYDRASGTAALYLNGTAVAVQYLGVFTPLTTYDFYLGYSPPDPSFSVGYYSGLMDEMSVYNTALSASQIQTIYVAGAGGKCAVAPVIVGQPQSQSVFEGRTASFSVNAGGSQPLSYQWSLNETNIPAATNATLVLTNVQLGQSGNIYSVLVTNLEGSTNSSNAVLTVTPAPPCTSPAASLVSWWAAEGNTADSFGGNNGVAQGSLTYVPGEVNQAFQFDGTSAAVHVPASTSMNVGTNSGLTIEGWIKPTSLTANQPLAEWNNGSDTLAVHFWINQPTMYAGTGPGSMIGVLDDNAGGNHWIDSPANVLSTNSWNHVALTYDRASGTAALYLNGVAVAVQNLGVFTPLTTYDFYLGYSPQDPSFGVGYYSGLMDEMSLYNTALSSNQIQAIYNAGSAGKCPPQAAPVIISQPAGQLVPLGGTATFSVGAVGEAPLSYQWQFNQSNILGNATATNATLVLTNVQAASAGSYSVVVSNFLGSTNSSNAVLTVVVPGSCLPPPSSLVSWWAAEGNTTDSFGTNNGLALGNLTYAPGEVDQAFQFDGTTTAVHVPASTSMNVGTNSGLTIEGWIKPSSLTANQPLAEWNNGSDTLAVHFWINQPTIYSGTGPGSMIGILDDNAGGNHWINSPPNVLSTNSWNYVALTYDKASGTAALYLNGVAVAVQNVGVFTPLTTYDFYLGYSPPDPSFGVGYYSGLMDEMSLYNTALSSNQIQAIYVAGNGGKCPPQRPPTITSQPANQAVPLGNTATFSVGASGTAPLSYQWRFNQSNILANATATNATLVLTNVQAASAGSYSVVVSNFFGSTNSSNAVLTVLFPPTIVVEPRKQLAQLGCTVAFSSAAVGSGTLTYQWQKNGANLSGQNGTNLALLDIQFSDLGNYTMIASNAYGTATSTVAVLALDHLPVPGGIIVQRFPGAGVRMNTGDILAKATDADNDLLSLIAVSTTSVEGGTVSLVGPSIYYLPPAGLAYADAFNYTISDGHCDGTAVGTVLVNVRSDTNPASRVTIVQAGNGSVQVFFDGMPGVTYQVQSTDSLTPSNWQNVTNLTADQYGTYIYVDWPATNGPVRYFRSVSP
jgi:Pro-kumamolisin, activation domain/Concanavalin A-like lectin/glucanases superfamily/Immunoglobulin domain/Bacterial Ig domain/Immunoglobulin I-set domain/Viral BACON domain